MTLSLKNPKSSQFPPSGWNFSDPKTGMSFNGYQGSPEMIAVKVAEHRRANPKFYPGNEGQNVQNIVQEIYAAKHAKMPWLFRGEPDLNTAAAYPSQPDNAPVAKTSAACSCGATEVKPVYCPTCSGKRVTGYTCIGCGKSRQL